ncbi:MAG: rhodanese-like domain-containing protein, partial [Methanothrix sp.]|uniref:rhodanese-like domain-containing protein n=1 Tax=Methanothrix sp. TaxID=90426 RepID=UPI003C739641
TIPAAEYNSSVRPGVIAEYDYVKSGQARIVDVRPFVDFGKGRIPASTALDPANVIKGDKIKNGGDLGTVFSRLDKDMPIVVYSDDYSQSALVAYSLQLMGYEAAVYFWGDWQAHEGKGDDTDSKYVKLGKT